MHAYIHAYMHTCIHAYMHTCIHAYMHTCIHAYMHTCIHAYIHTYIYIYTGRTKVALLELPTVNMFGFFFCTPFPRRILAWSFVVPRSHFHPPKVLKSYIFKRGWQLTVPHLPHKTDLKMWSAVDRDGCFVKLWRNINFVPPEVCHSIFIYAYNIVSYMFILISRHQVHS